MTAIYNATHYFSTTGTVLLLRHLVKHVVAKNRTPSQLHAVTIALAKELLLLAWISGGSIWRFYSLGPGLRRLLGCGAWRLLVLAHLIAARHSVIIVLLSLIFKTALVDASPYSPLQNLFVRTDMINNTVRNSNLPYIVTQSLKEAIARFQGHSASISLVPSSPPDLRLPGEKKMSCRGVLGCCACRVPRSAVQSEQVHSRRSTQTLLNRDGADVR